MKPQATRIGNRKKALAAVNASALWCLSTLRSRMGSLRFHPKHARWSAAVLAVVAFTTLCVQAITAPRDSVTAVEQWHPVSLPVAAEPSLMPELIPTESQQPAQPELSESAFQVRNGDSLSLVFSRAGYGASTVHGVAYETEHGNQLSRIYPGQEIRFYKDAEGQLSQIQFAKDELEYYLVEKTDQGFVSSHVFLEPEVFPQLKSGTIDTSFYLAAQRAGLTDNQIMELAALFGWDIDFVLEIRQGDSFSVVYEDRYLNGEQITPGNILAAEFINQGRVLRAVRYEHSDGRVAYYNPEGQSMRKAFLRAPLDVFRISSSFNLNRRHPILNTIRAHKGADYAAPSGTPIKASGDGRVIFSGVDGGFGNVVRIQHGQNYMTVYAHMSRFASGVRNGTYVRQGQTIGYVGMTGLATGPHLHYEFHVNGSVRNPVTVDLPNGDPIPSSELNQFKLLAQPMLALLDTLSPDQQYANFTSGSATDI